MTVSNTASRPPALSIDTAVDALQAMLEPGRSEEFIALLHDEATWTIPGDWPHVSGVKDRAGVERFVRVGLPAAFPYGVTIEVHHVHIAEQTAVIEFTSRATTSKDRAYKNVYCFVFEFRDGRLFGIREYMDTLYANAVLHT